MERRVFCLWVTLAALNASLAQADDVRLIVPAAEAEKHVGQEVVVELVVNSGRLLASGKFCFLNSEQDFQSKTNFTVAVRGDAIEKLAKEDIKDPAEHFRGKKIRVTGKVALYNDRAQIVVTDPKQIAVVDKK